MAVSTVLPEGGGGSGGGVDVGGFAVGVGALTGGVFESGDFEAAGEGFVDTGTTGGLAGPASSNFLSIDFCALATAETVLPCAAAS